MFRQLSGADVLMRLRIRAARSVREGGRMRRRRRWLHGERPPGRHWGLWCRSRHWWGCADRRVVGGLGCSRVDLVGRIRNRLIDTKGFVNGRQRLLGRLSGSIVGRRTTRFWRGASVGSRVGGVAIRRRRPGRVREGRAGHGRVCHVCATSLVFSLFALDLFYVEQFDGRQCGSAVLVSQPVHRPRVLPAKLLPLSVAGLHDFIDGF